VFPLPNKLHASEERRKAQQQTSGCRKLSLEVRRPVEILEELRALQRDLDELGDSVAVALLERAERCFLFVRWTRASAF
jgi:hypothetical protein